MTGTKGATAQILQGQGLEVEVLWRKSREEKGITGDEIRRLIAADKEWQQYVPKTVGEYLTSHSITERIRGVQYLYE